jgi:hypothetical protein
LVGGDGATPGERRNAFAELRRIREIARMVLIQLLLPTAFPGETAARDATAALADTREELAKTFAGLTTYVRSPAKGVWTAPDGHTEHDDVVMVEVVTDRFDRAWWRTYALELAARFRQDSIHVRALEIQLLDEDQA